MYLFQSLGEIPKAQESLTSGKIIPTGRRKLYASPPVRKVFPDFKITSLEDEKSSDTNNKTLKLCLDAMIDFHRRYPDGENYLKMHACFQIDHPLSRNLHNTPHAAMVSRSRFRKLEEVELVEGVKDPVGCFQAARRERDSTISATSGNLPISEKPKKRKKQKSKKNGQIKKTNEICSGLAEFPSKNGLESGSPETEVSGAGVTSGTPYFSCEDVDMISMEKINLGSFPDFANTLVSVAKQKFGPEASIQICGNGIEYNKQGTADSRPTKRSQESDSSHKDLMEEAYEKNTRNQPSWLDKKIFPLSWRKLKNSKESYWKEYKDPILVVQKLFWHLN